MSFPVAFTIVGVMAHSDWTKRRIFWLAYDSSTFAEWGPTGEPSRQSCACRAVSLPRRCASASRAFRERHSR